MHKAEIIDNLFNKPLIHILFMQVSLVQHHFQHTQQSLMAEERSLDDSFSAELTQLGVREDDPQYYDSDNESDNDAVEPSEAPGSTDSEHEEDIATQVEAVPNAKDFEKFDVCDGSYSITHEQFMSTASSQFCQDLHRQTGTDILCPSTINGVIDFVPKLDNGLIVRQIIRDRAGHAAKSLIITIWLIVCLKGHCNTGMSISTSARKDCAVLRHTAVDLAHDHEFGERSKGFLRRYLTYWERRVREKYASPRTSMCVRWDNVAWWLAPGLATVEIVGFPGQTAPTTRFQIKTAPTTIY